MLKVHFLNVGKGNCVIARFPSGRLTVVDIDNSRVETDNPLQDPIEFLDFNYPNEHVFRFVLTHPDMDHMSGIKDLADSRTILNFWDTDNNKTAEETKMHLGGYDADDWQCYQRMRECDENPKTLHIYQGDNPREFWKEDRVTVLGPSRAMVVKANETGNYNHCSYVLSLEHLGIRLLLGGDATKESWSDILEYWGPEALKADVFLAPHHGSSENIEKDVFRHIEPDYVVISDHYGHSYDYDYYSNLARKRVYSTKHFGNVVVEIDAGRRTITTQRNS